MTQASRRTPADVAVPAVILAVLAWGVGPLMVRGMDVEGTTVALYRMWSGTPVMLVAARAFGAPLDRKVLRAAAVPGVFFGLSMMLGFQAVRATSIASATLIGALTPAVILLGANRIVGERSDARRVPFAVVAFAGLAMVVLVGGDRNGSTLHGDLLAFGNLACFTVYFLILKKLRNAGLNSWAFLAGVFVVGTLVITPWCVATGDDVGTITMKDVLLLGGMVLGPGLVGHGLISWASRHLPVTTTSLLTLGSPVVSVIGGWLIYDQQLGWGQVVGAVLVIGGLAGTVWDTSTRREPLLDPA
ncbi:MAG: DMT family transporter [Actinomycetota bacterium]